MPESKSAHFLYSSRREKILENLFSGEVLKELWRRQCYEVDMLHSDIDASGYDVVLELPEGTRHIQLKASTKRKPITANGKICDRPSGCIIVMLVDEATLDFKSFLWLGDDIGSKCPNIRAFPKAKHTKADSTGKKSTRSDSYRVSLGRFNEVFSISNVVDMLLK